ncbi:hypothetical protein SLE2022_321400 [Rubroshorea leprosula]
MTDNGDPGIATTAGAERKLNDRKLSWTNLHRGDSFNLEAGRVSSAPNHHASHYQSGVWRHRSISPLCVSSTFTDGIKHVEDVLGVLSLIIYTIVLIPFIKYTFLVLWANDNGEGGTLALYSLLSRYARISLVPNQKPKDSEVSNYRLEPPPRQLKRASMIKKGLENSRFIQVFLFLVTILGTSMVIGDGILTPSISVLSAVGGISSLSTDAVVGISVAIQRFGTDKVGFSFAPIISVWFAFLTGIGLYNLFEHEVSALRAFNPYYIVKYFKRNGKSGWISLDGVILCITGTEAMFADLGHFNVRAIQSAKGSCRYILLCMFSILITVSRDLCRLAFLQLYCHQYPEHFDKMFYKSIPGPLYLPQFVVAVLAAIIASQAMISGTFSIISQSLSLGCFPKVKVIHTSAKYEGQVYIPEINYMLMVACVIVTAAFKTTTKIGNAYGIAVVAVMFVTTSMLTLIMLVIWKISIWWIALFFLIFGSIEIIYFSSVLYKFVEGGYLPLVFALVLMIIMAIWYYVYQKRYLFELEHKVSGEYIRQLAENPAISRELINSSVVALIHLQIQVVYYFLQQGSTHGG